MAVITKTISIKYNPVWAQIDQLDSVTKSNLIANILSYRSRKIAYLNSKRPDKYRESDLVPILDQQNRFYTGLLSRVYNALRNYGFEIELEQNIESVFQTPLIEPAELWEHQKEMLKEALLQARCIIQAPTASGKSKVIAHYTNHFPTEEVMIITPRREIMEQLALEIEQVIDEPVGRISGHKKTFHRVNVAVDDSLYRIALQYPSLLQNIKVLVIDECHNAGDNTTYKTICEAMPNAPYRLGLSATAIREEGDTAVMEGLLGPITLRIPASEMVSQEKIVEPTYAVVTTSCPILYTSDEKKPSRELVYKTSLVQNSVRNNYILNFAKAYLTNEYSKTHPALILVESIEHGKLLSQLFKRHRVRTDFISGETPLVERVTTVNLLKEGRIRLLIASSIFNEGLNIPNLGLGIIAGGGSSAKRIIQQLGRFTRTAEGKHKVYIIDFKDIEDNYLLRNSISRINAVKKAFPDAVKEITNESLLKELKSLDDQFPPT